MKRRSLSSSSYFVLARRDQKGAGDSILIMTQRVNVKPIYSDAVKSGDWIYIILDGDMIHRTAHLQVRWLCRGKSMKHETYLDTFQLLNTIERSPEDDFIESPSPDTFAHVARNYITYRHRREPSLDLTDLTIIIAYFNSRSTPAQRSCSRQTKKNHAIPRQRF